MSNMLKALAFIAAMQLSVGHASAQDEKTLPEPGFMLHWGDGAAPLGDDRFQRSIADVDGELGSVAIRRAADRKSFALRFGGRGDDVAIGAFADLPNRNDPAAVLGGGQRERSFGLNLGLDGFTIASAYSDRSNDAEGGWRRYGLGGVYDHGSAQVSFGYVREIGKTSDADSDSFELGVAFSLGSGVFATGSVTYIDQETAEGAESGDATLVGGLSLSF